MTERKCTHCGAPQPLVGVRSHYSNCVFATMIQRSPRAASPAGGTPAVVRRYVIADPSDRPTLYLTGATLTVRGLEGAFSRREMALELDVEEGDAEALAAALRLAFDNPHLVAQVTAPMGNPDDIKPPPSG
ncbi:MAG TPA: hypothetical protein VGP64_17985 [Polyangia bacterium]